MTYPSYGGRLLSPADLERLERYRQLIAASSLPHSLGSPLSRFSRPTSQRPTAPDSGPAQSLGDATSEAPANDLLLHSAYRPPAGLLSGELHQRVRTTPAGFPVSPEMLPKLWDWLRTHPKFCSIPPDPPWWTEPDLRPQGPDNTLGGKPSESPVPLLPAPEKAPPGWPTPLNTPPRTEGAPPTPVPPTILTGPDLLGRKLADLILESNPDGIRGNELTKKSNNIIIQECIDVAKELYPDFRHIGGGKVGGEGEKSRKEIYVRRFRPEPDVEAPGRKRTTKGSSYPDVSFQSGNGDPKSTAATTAHVNTTTMNQWTGEMTPDEDFRLDRLKKNLAGFGDGVVRAFSSPKLLSDDPSEVAKFRAQARGLCYEILNSLGLEVMKEKIPISPDDKMSPY